ncbi:hypothetical protein [Amycolatopsis magusensis]|uniref:hypothetical protein n=1 Tax=Amycolatopsis magusensis TaxID=882444 RepID=UPI003C2DF23C
MGARWQAGDVVDGRYQVERVFENGGMGLVYRVRHLAWGVDLAVKCPRPELFCDELDRQRFVDEAQVWVSLGLHPNVCACHYVRTLAGIPRLFAEFVPGGNLTDRICDGRLYEGDRIAVLARILDFAIQLATGQCLRTFETGPVRTARFTGGGRFLAGGGRSGISVWDVHSGRLVRAPAEPSVSDLAATPDHLLAAALRARLGTGRLS